MDINLNADLGESFGRYILGNDEALLKLVKSASVACGFHAGDPKVMAKAVRLAVENGVSIGAHPSFDDLRGFGRRPIHMPARDIENLIAYQIGALQGIAAAAGARVTHVKPHGALNNMAHVDRGYAEAIARAIKAVDRDLIFVANACSEMASAGKRLGLRVAEEAYIDRTYDDDGKLTSRDRPDAIIHEQERAINQVLSFLDAGGLVTRSGKQLRVQLHTFCAHGDDAASVETVRAVRHALEQRGVHIVPLPELRY
ncbi:MAG TPA: 5-oxoprolinase subunit PxpA [Burkholderiales bacterium]|nr:5-oxoprolinase subunit PxpA [Burkholderiales bacterium]